MLAVQLVVLQLLSFFPEWVERWYSNGLFPYISKTSRWLLDFLPFSFGDLAYMILILYFGWRIVRAWGTYRTKWRSHLRYILSVVSVMYLLFNVLWGLNYLRVPLSDKMGIGHEYTRDELLRFTRTLIAQTNALHLTITHADLPLVPGPGSELSTQLPSGYGRLSEIYPQFAHEGYGLRKSLLSWPLTYMGFSGYLNPFTNEAHVNDMLPDYSYPATASHEMAHQIGYASESEANFVGYLAAIQHQNPTIRYSGYCLALRYCLAEWEYRDEKVAAALEKSINPGILKNFKQSHDFWAQHETFLEKGFHAFYDNFLKINQQEDGLEGYSRFVNLLVNYYRPSGTQ